MTLSPMSPVAPPASPEAAQAAQAARQKASEMLARCSALALSEDFQWFMRTCIREKIVEANGKAMSTTATDRERDEQVHIHDALLHVYGWVEENLATSRAVVNPQ